MSRVESLPAAELAALLELPDFSARYREADTLRAKTVGDTVHIRAILEFSNHCRRNCCYCGLRCAHKEATRYRMSPAEILACAQEAADAGYKTLVMQSGEDTWFTPERLGNLVRQIVPMGLSVTLSCGEMPQADYAYLRDCGAARYLLKHETASPALYAALHPGDTLEQRVRCLRDLKSLGYETGGGFMIGLPDQSTNTIAHDLLLLRELGCDMAGIGPFLPHPATPLAHTPPGSAELTKRAVALARLLLPGCNLPATTSLGVLDTQEKNDIFSCGANVIMRKVTPTAYKTHYQIYPANLPTTNIKAERLQLEAQICALGRIPL